MYMSMVRIIVILTALSLGGSLAALADPPNLTPMNFLPGDATLGPAAGDQTSPVIARGAADLYLAAWQDDRGASPDIYIARIEEGGNAIDTPPIAVTQAAGAQSDPRVAWNGSNWLVTWKSQVPTQYYYSYGVLGVRVTAQGQVLDSTPIVIIAYQNSSGLMYSLASDGTNWAVVAQGMSAGEAAIRGARVAPDGTVLDPGGIVIVPETYYLRFGIELGGNPGEYLLVWNEWRSGTADDILAYRLNPSLSKMEANPFVVASRAMYETNAKVASNGTGFFVAWNLNDNYLSSDVYGARVSSAGQVLDPNGRAFSNAGYGYGRTPSVAWDGVNWIASWPNYGTGGLNAGRMTPQGSILDPGGVSMPDLGWGSIAGAAGGGFVAAWSDGNGGSQDVYAAHVAGNLAAGPRLCASLGAPRQTQASFAHNGDGYLAVFLSARSNGSRILGQRIDANGNAIDPEPFEIVGPAAAYGPPSVAWDGLRYMVSYVYQSKIYVRRVAPDGALLDPAPILVMNGLESSIAALDGVFLVTGNNAPQNPEYVFVFGTRMRGSDGAKLDASPISIGQSFSLHPRVAMVGNRWFVAWEQHPTHDDPHASVIGNFVDASGVAGTSFRIDSGAAAYNLRPTVAANADTAFVVWSESHEGSNNLDIYGRRVLSAGTLLDANEIAIAVAPNSQTLPVATWDGAEFVALFQDPRGIPYFFDEHLDVYGVRVTGGGQVIDPSGFAFAKDPIVSEIQPAAAGGGGAALLGCSVYREGAPFAAFRIGTRLLRHLGLSDVAGDGGAADGRRGLHLSASPNPSADRFELRIANPENPVGDVTIFDASGREIAPIYAGRISKEGASIVWDGRSASGGRAAPGVYFARARSGSEAKVVKLILR